MSDAGVTLAQVEAAIEASWTAETSVDPTWSPTNPALGQCAVTALVVQDYLGGDLIRVVNDGVSHYFNLVVGPGIRVTEVDLTRGQFDTWEPSAPEVRDRTYVLSFPATLTRYELLAAAVAARLA